jgi:hypothetical protein
MKSSHASLLFCLTAMRRVVVGKKERYVLQHKWAEVKRTQKSALNQPQDYVTEITSLQPGTPDDRRTAESGLLT